ncbi:embryo-specific protein ATS3B-like [Quercus robur]|uniref:embryo-specific protein ATS3B-like n=1 Tax=Quercus robur TaxID=38942 RepID=UPI002163136B|nr:embryo-specific protein ATS3B-like [Quercus robur]
MKRTSILLIFIVSITIFSPAFGNKPNNQALLGSQKNCSYSIEIQTTCAPSADTTDHVSVRFSDSLGNLIIVKHLKNPKLLYAPKGGLKKQGGAYSGFERCAIDMFEVLHTQDGGHVVPVSYMFYFRTFVPENVWYGFDYCHSNGAFMPHAADFSRKD